MFTKGLIHARSRLPGVPLYQLDARDLPFQDEFDLVCAFDVLEHIDADDRALASMFRATRSGGGALVTVPQHQRLWSKSDVDALHVRRYNRRELVSKLVTAGFVVRYVTSFITTVLPLMAISRLFSRFNIAAKDPWAEFRQAERIGSVLERLVAIDLAFIRRGVSLPIGGSLLAVASKP
jgi:SAM-dependent methyltransferase